MTILRIFALLLLTGLVSIAPQSARAADCLEAEAFRLDEAQRRADEEITGDDPPRPDRANGALTPVRPGELRVLALYGPREFSTFSSVLAGPRSAGETPWRGKPLDRQPEDLWLGIDKAKHVAFSFLWTLGTQYVAVNKGHLSEAHALPISIGTSAAVGVSKEVYDLRSGPPHVFSYRDLVANGVGILLATGLILL